MRKLLSSFAITALLCTVLGTAQAGTFNPATSFINFGFSGLQPSITYAPPGTWDQVVLVDNGVGGHDIAMGPSVWSTVNFGQGTSLFTGVPIISTIRVTIQNPSVTLQSGYSYTNYVGGGGVNGPYLGGVAPLNGTLMVWALGAPVLGVSMGMIGGPPGTQVFPSLLGLSMSVTGGPWATGSLTMTGITTNVITVNGVTGVGVTLQATPLMNARDLSTGGGFVSTGGGLPLEVHTITFPGSNELLSASQSGTVTLTAPMRINTTPAVAGRLPAGALWTISFVPEPGTMLLLTAGAVALVVVGRRRIRK